MSTLNDKYGVSELRQGGNKSLAQGLEEYLNPEFAEPNTLRMFIGNAVSNAREMVGMDEESLARNQDLRAASQKLFDYTLGHNKGQALSPEERAELEVKDKEYAVNTGSLSPAMGTIKTVISPEQRAKNLSKFMEGSKIKKPAYRATVSPNIEDVIGRDGVAFWSNEHEYPSTYSKLIGGKVTTKAHLKMENPMTIPAEPWEFSDPSFEAPYIRNAIENGNDGVIFIDKENGDEFYVTLKNSKIKSATGNRGTFDPSDPNILHSLAPIGALGGLGSLYGANEGDR